MSPKLNGDAEIVALADAAPEYSPPELAEWPVPLPLPSELSPVAPFDFALLPEALRPWIEDIADRYQCPPDFAAVGAMIALAGIVGRKVGIRPKQHDDWLVVPNLWGAVIGRPGVMKTPSIKEPLKFIHELESQAKLDHAAAVAQYEAAQIVEKQEKRATEDAIRKAIQDGGDPHALAQEHLANLPAAPKRRRYIVNDTTVEKLGEIMNENPNGVIAFRDELVGLLKGLDREGQEGARSFYLEAWAGDGRFTYDRIGRGTLDIEATTLSILGGIQPGPLEAYLEAAARGGAGDDGLIQRFQLLVWPDVSSDWHNVDRTPSKAAEMAARAVYTRLAELDARAAGAFDPDREGGIPYVRFSADAQGRFDEWREELERRIRSGVERPALESHLGKYRSLVPSLALLIHLADGGIGAVRFSALERAIGWHRYLETHARRIYAPTMEPEWKAARALADRIGRGDVKDGFAGHEVYRHHWGSLKTPEELRAATGALSGLHWLREVREVTGGAPKTTYRINPKAVDMLKGRCKK